MALAGVKTLRADELRGKGSIISVPVDGLLQAARPVMLTGITRPT